MELYTVSNREKHNFRSEPLTIAYIRDSIRKNSYAGDLFEALEFMLTQYDIVNDRLRSYTKPTEYKVYKTGADVV